MFNFIIIQKLKYFYFNLIRFDLEKDLINISLNELKGTFKTFSWLNA